MSADLVVTYLFRTFALAGVALVLVFLSVWLAGRLCRSARLPAGLTLLAQLAAPVTLFFAASLLFDAAGEIVRSTVTRTEERISYRGGGGRSLPGAWSRSFWATVTFENPEGTQTAPLWIDEATYDALPRGATIDIRYVPWLPFLARPADQSTRTLVPWRWATLALGVGGIALVLRPIVRRVAGPLRALIVLTSIALFVIWWVFPTPWDTPLEEPVLTAEAEVRHLREVTRSFTSGRATGVVSAPQPWNLVELHFIPAGWGHAVIAVDGVDVGSVPGLQVGARLPIRYSASHPRDARLAGTRTWRWKEWRELASLVVWLVVLLAGLVVLGKVIGAWWQRQVGR